MFYNQKESAILNTLRKHIPDAIAQIRGSKSYSSINGKVEFFSVGRGTLVNAFITGLPRSDTKCPSSVFGFHIHSGTSCTGTIDDPFRHTLSHYNPNECQHPSHAGDLPPLFGNNGLAWFSVYTERFKLTDIIGRTVVIHDMPDDFISQPSGNSGEKIACGLIVDNK